MPVYNGEPFLASSIESILQQTFSEFEFLIINDGSTDGSLDIIKSYARKDSRIRFVTRNNKGLISTLNEGLAMIETEYIARQDSDDISLTSRLKKQVEFLDKNTSIGLVGSNYHTVNNRGQIIGTTDVLTTPNDLKLAEVFSNQFGHGTIMARGQILKSKKTYNQEYKHSEDYELWARLAREQGIANIKEPLYKWRLHDENVTIKHPQIMKDQTLRIRKREFKYFREHKSDYRILTFHPKSIRGGVLRYFQKKNTLFRDMALMYCYSGYRRYALLTLLLAILHAPWIVKTYKQLFIILFAKSKIRTIKFESI